MTNQQTNNNNFAVIYKEYKTMTILNDISTTLGVSPLLITLSILSFFTLTIYTFLILKPRTKIAKTGGSSPPVITTSPISKLPVVGTIIEFGISPVKMVQRCYEEYGPVFTVPVSCI